MPRNTPDRPDRPNRLLSLLPKAAQRRLAPKLTRKQLGIKTVLCEAGKPIRNVYFPIGAVCSLVVQMDSGHAAEVATVGDEGFVGTPVFLGADRSPIRAFSQGPGGVLSMSSRDFVVELDRRGALYEIIRRYTQSHMNMISQTTVCNTLHSVDKRMCRWLLIMRDRVHSDTFTLTHEFLGKMLGVRRASVTVVAGQLRKRGLISYSRSVISILDRKGLEEEACPCYAIVRRESERLIANGNKSQKTRTGTRSRRR